jgi:ABC-type multidrug transport system ATPase subunit
MTGPIIEAHELGKNYGTTPVLRAVELAVGPGEGAVVIGKNGAGKSTLVRILAGLTAPSSGRALLFGQEAPGLSAGVRCKLGIVTHQSFLYPNLTGRENLEFYGHLYGIGSPGVAAERWLERVGLRASAGERVRAFSRGMEQRLAIARAMIIEPQALILDEPFAGLDSDGTALVADLIREGIARACAVLVTAHSASGFEQFHFSRYELKGGRLAPSGEPDRRSRLRALLGG